MLVPCMLRTSLQAGSSSLNARVAQHLARTSSASQLRRSFSAARSNKPNDDETKVGASSSKDNKTEEQLAAPQLSKDGYTGKFYENLPISFADISRAEVRIRGGVKRTACEHSPFISELVGANVYFKPEFRQYTGSFKERGARNAILSLMREKKDKLRGVVAAR